MKWLSLLLQLASMRRSFLESRAVIDGAKAAAERGKKAALFAVAALFALLFLLAGIFTAVIEGGLQYERGEFLRFSGLFGSSLVFLLIGFLILGAAAYAVRGSGEEEMAPVPAPEPLPGPALDPEVQLKRVAASVALRFLDRLKARSDRGPR